MNDCRRECDCRNVTRRELLRATAGAAAASVALPAVRGLAAPGDFPPSAQTPPPAEWFDALFVRGEPPAYTGEALKEVALPLGGIGTGTVWLHGSGRLINWQIFNNIDRSSQVDDCFFLVRIEPAGQPPILRALQLAPIGDVRGMASVRFVGQYPFAYLDFEDPALPVRVRLEAFNPMIPLNEDDSSIPCAIFRVSATNTSGSPVRVGVLASMQNAVGHQGRGASVSTHHPTYGRNVNRVVRSPAMIAVNMTAEPGVPAELERPLTVVTDHGALTIEDAWPVRNLTVRSVGPKPAPAASAPAVYWIARGDVTRMGGAALAAVVEAVRGGATLLLSGVDNPLLRVVTPTGEDTPRDEETFADFEGAGYGAWKVQGEGFGDGPAHGAFVGQQPVSGYLGGGLVNTFNPNDFPKGSLTSPPFVIRKRYVTLLVGGGKKPGGCCVNLRVGGQIVRTATGKEAEVLERHTWDVQDLLGREAVIEILDNKTVGWSHILADDIRFSNLPTETITPSEAAAWNEMLPATFAAADPKAERGVRAAAVDRSAPEVAGIDAERLLLTVVPGRTPLSTKDGTRVVARLRDDSPAMLAATFGKGRVFVLPADAVGSDATDAISQRDRWTALLAGLAGVRFQPAAGRPTSAPSFGTLCLATPHTDASVQSAWQERERLIGPFAETGVLPASPAQQGPTGPGETLNAAIATSATAPPGGTANAEFVLTWHFPNQYYPQAAWRVGAHKAALVGNMYANRFHDAASVAAYVITGRDRLRDETERFRRCLYDSTLPAYFVDCVGANASILRSPTCFWIKDGTFYGFEGCNAQGGCCPMNCNHVWNYEHTLSKLWPALERNMRITELEHHQEPDGGIHHRVAVPRTNPVKHAPPVADGQCGAVLKAYREHRQSGDLAFLGRQWPRVKKAMDFAITNWDSDADGLLDRPQFNTYDRVIFGLNTFVSSLYLAALRAGEEMARLARDEDSAKRYRALFEKGRKLAAEKLFNGEYYVQIADNLAGGYGTGCLADQVVGQWWARVLDLGDILPVEQVRSSLAAVYRYCWLTTQQGFEGTQRYLQFADGDDKALLICAWPKGGRPDDPIYYRDEAWTGVEYQVAAHKIWEGQLREALAIVRGARERYNGVKRNPWNEIECGDYYARAMSSWTLLLAAQGYRYDGPMRSLGFDPRLQPDDHRSFFSVADGWGTFEQKRAGRKQTNRLTLAYGHCELAELSLGLPAGAKTATAKATVGTREPVAKVTLRDGVARLSFPVAVALRADETLEVALDWA